MPKTICHPTSTTPFAAGGLTITCPACKGSINIAAAVATVVAQRTAELEDKASRIETDFAKREASLKKETSHLAEVLQAREAELKQQADADLKKAIAAQQRQHQQALASLAAQNTELQAAQTEILGSTATLIQEGMKKTENRLLPQIQNLQEELNQAKLEASKRFKDGQTKAMADSAKTLGELQALIDDQRKKSVIREKAHAATLAQAVAEAEFAAEQKVKQAQKAAVLKAKADLETNIRTEVEHEHAVLQQEKERKIQGLCTQIEELKQKAMATTSNAKGLAAQDVLEDALNQTFPRLGDQVVPFKAGQRGSDFNLIIHSAGKRGILIESKWTQTFDSKWIAKATDDKAAAKADLVVLVTRTLPTGVESLVQMGEVWVCAPSVAISLISALRQGLLKIEAARKAHNLNEAQMAGLRQFLSGPQFRAQVETLVTLATTLKESLSKERHHHERSWLNSQQSFEKVLSTALGIWSEVDLRFGGGLEPSEVLRANLIPEEEPGKPVKTGKKVA